MVVERCVACNKLIPLDKVGNHKCSKRVEAGRLAAQRRYSGYIISRNPTFNQRLAAGFQLLKGYDQ